MEVLLLANTMSFIASQMLSKKIQKVNSNFGLCYCVSCCGWIQATHSNRSLWKFLLEGNLKTIPKKNYNDSLGKYEAGIHCNHHESDIEKNQRCGVLHAPRWWGESPRKLSKGRREFCQGQANATQDQSTLHCTRTTLLHSEIIWFGREGSISTLLPVEAIFRVTISRNMQVQDSFHQLPM